MSKVKKILKVMFTGVLMFAATAQRVFADVIAPTTEPSTNIVSSGSADLIVPGNKGLSTLTIIIICGAAILVIWLVSLTLLRYFKKKK